MWRPQIDALRAHYRCIVPDLWGHGASSLLHENEYSTAKMGDDYLQFTTALNL
jgi:pimeloyl-ACP methyl ester carboxylesterase